MPAGVFERAELAHRAGLGRRLGCAAGAPPQPAAATRARRAAAGWRRHLGPRLSARYARRHRHLCNWCVGGASGGPARVLAMARSDAALPGAASWPVCELPHSACGSAAMHVCGPKVWVLSAGYHYTFKFLKDAGVITVKENWCACSFALTLQRVPSVSEG